MKAFRFLALVLIALSCNRESAVPDVPPVVRKVNISVRGGNNRIVCSWNNLPKTAVSIKLRFEGTLGQYNIPVSVTSGEKSIENALPEGDHTVTPFCILGDGSQIEGKSSDIHCYGERYQAGLSARTLVNYIYEGTAVVLNFGKEPDGDYAGEEISYEKTSGEKVCGIIRNSTIRLEDVGSPISYRSAFKPEINLDDLFYTGKNVVAYRKEPKEYNLTVDGYRGLWFDLGQASSYGSKYSGGLGTYTMKHIPMAIYAPEVERTYFVYGGTPSQDKKYLLCMVGCYDHKTGLLQKPRIVMDKEGVNDPHDDPTIQIDKNGYIWIFVSGRGNKRPGKRFRSVNPYDITAFEFVSESIMAYPQIIYNREKGFFLFFTRYDGTRQLFYQKSTDGETWTPYKQLASIKEGTEKNSGHYQISNICGNKLCTAFNRHINGDVDTRTNIYFIQSTDWGETWTTVDGQPVKVPVTERYSNCLVKDYQITTETHNCYIKDVNFDTAGNPIILYLTSRSHKTGPEGGTRQWHVLHWTGTKWDETLITTSTHCYDSGSLWVEGNEWTVIAPTDAGPQYWGTGGEVVMWRTNDEGKNWDRVMNLTKNSINNQSYMRRPWNCSDEFYSFWADGSPDKLTISYLYFCNKKGEVYRMPYNMTGQWAKPEKMTF